jgi:hypothetical protein
MASKIEEMAEAWAEKHSDDRYHPPDDWADCPYEEIAQDAFLAGARAVLEEARKMADGGVYGGYNRRLLLSDLEALFAEQKEERKG